MSRYIVRVGQWYLGGCCKAEATRFTSRAAAISELGEHNRTVRNNARLVKLVPKGQPATIKYPVVGIYRVKAARFDVHINGRAIRQFTDIREARAWREVVRRSLGMQKIKVKRCH